MTGASQHSEDNRRPVLGLLTAALAVFLMLVLPLNSLAQDPDALFSDWDSEVSGETDVQQLSLSDLRNPERTIYITDNWLFHPGDSMTWAQKSYDDSHWETISTMLGATELPFIDWKGTGWFRLHLKVDSTLVNKPLALLPKMHNGASEVYFDSKQLYKMGQPGAEQNVIYRTDQIPRGIVFPDTNTHVLAVRYVNHDVSTFSDFGYDAGFRLMLGSLDHHVLEQVSAATSNATNYMLVIGILLAFAIIHIMLYGFYPENKEHLYFSIFVGFMGLLSFADYQVYFSHNPLDVITFQRVSLITWMLTVIYALRFTYSLFFEKVPKQFWGFFVIGLGLAIYTWYKPSDTYWYRSLFVALTLLELTRVLFQSFFQQKEGVWIIGSGLALFIMGILGAIFINLEIIPGEPEMGNMFGTGGLILAMSVYLSRDVAQTNLRLKQNLNEVKRLSQERLHQEKINRQKEIERKLLEAENERKTNELEEARALQLSMLPQNIPCPPNWDIAVHMSTASEVGGDYYDFSRASEDDLTLTLGDAAGHGMKAGIVVAAAKSYFHTLANRYDNVQLLKQMSHGIRSMNVKKMFMGLSLIKLNGSHLRMATAGMPPALWYRKEQGRVEQIVLKGLPLGSPVDFPYTEKQISMGRGDVMLLMSDGLMELFSPEREMLGVERIEVCFRDHADKSPSEIVEELNNLAAEWKGEGENEDDITLMVIKSIG